MYLNTWASDDKFNAIFYLLEKEWECYEFYT